MRGRFRNRLCRGGKVGHVVDANPVYPRISGISPQVGAGRAWKADDGNVRMNCLDGLYNAGGRFDNDPVEKACGNTARPTVE